MGDVPRVIYGNLLVNDESIIRFVDNFEFGSIKRFYQAGVHNTRSVHGWIGHKLGATYIYIAKGIVSFAVTQMDLSRNGQRKIEKFVLASSKPAVLFIPPGFYYQYKTLNDDWNTIIIFYSTTTSEESMNDNFYMPWDEWGDVFRYV